MNFTLRRLESSLDEEALLRGEELLESGSVGPLTEVERHLWVATVDEGQSWEVEVKISPSRVKAGTCECDTFRNTQSCGHFAAVLLALRRQLRQQKKKKKGSGAAPRTKKLTTSVVLDHVDQKELIDFVREYARTHRNFALALKARFASNVEVMDSKDKFLQLLDSTINLARRPDRTISKRGYQKIVKVLSELREQSEAALVMGHYLEALHINQSMLEKVTPVLGKILTETNLLEQQLDTTFRTLERILAQSAAPALRKKIWEYGLSEYHKLAYRKQGIDLEFIRLLEGLATEPSRAERLIAAIDEHIDTYQREFRQTTPLLLIKLQLLEGSGWEREAQQLIRDNLLHTGILKHAIEKALRLGQTQQAKELARAGLDAQEEPATRRKLEQYLLEIAEREGDHDTLHRLLVNKMLDTLDFSYYQKLRTSYDEDWKGEYPAVLEQIRTLPLSFERDVFIARILVDEEAYPELLAHLQQHGTLELLQRFDEYLLPHHEEELLVLYRDQLTQYVKQHLGPKSSRKIRQTLDHLQALGMEKLAARLVQEFRTNYPERHTLMEQLSLYELP